MKHIKQVLALLLSLVLLLGMFGLAEEPFAPEVAEEVMEEVFEEPAESPQEDVEESAVEAEEPIEEEELAEAPLEEAEAEESFELEQMNVEPCPEDQHEEVIEWLDKDRHQWRCTVCGETSWDYHFAYCDDPYTCMDCGGACDYSDWKNGNPSRVDEYLYHRMVATPVDSQYHTYKCTVDGTVGGQSEHWFPGGSDVCDECGYKRDAGAVSPCPEDEHEWDWDHPVWKDNTFHILTCTVCGAQEPFDHFAWCTSPNVCMDCGGVRDNEYDDQIYHSWDVGRTYESIDASQHRGICNGCNAVLGVEEHEFINGVCRLCGYESETPGNYCPEDEHEWDWDHPVYVSEAKHAYKCMICGYVDLSYQLSHTADCTEPTLCTECGGYAGPDSEIEHAYLNDSEKTFTYKDNDHHVWICPKCDEEVEEVHEVHCSQTEPYTCEICKHAVEMEVADLWHDCDYDNLTPIDEHMHGFKCKVCGYIMPMTPIEEGEHWAWCNAPGVCVDCGAEYPGMKTVHDMENGVCTRCGAKEDAPVQPCPEDEHDFGDAAPTWVSDTLHSYTCVKCGYVELSEHWMKCNAPGVCVDCGGSCDEYAAIWMHQANVKREYYDETRHKISCSKCKSVELREHDFEDGVCQGCGYRQGEAISCEGELTLTVKEAYTLKPVSPADKKFEFSTSNAKIASVSKGGGKITAKSAGTAIITVKGKTSKMTASCTLTIIPAPTKVNIAPLSKAEYTTDDAAFALAASVEPPEAVQGVKWTSSDETVARVSEDGQVTLVGQGKATIKATTEKKGTNGKKRSASVTLNVTDPHMPASISISEKASAPLYVNKGETLALHSEMKPVTEGQEVRSGVIWSIPAKQQKYATIDAQTGVLQAKDLEGSVTVTVKTEKKGGTGSKKKQLTDTVKITVVDPTKPRSVQINEGEKEIPLYYEAGKTLTLQATIEPATATPGVKWSIPNKAQRKIATVDASTGVVTPTGNKFGVVTVKVETTAKKSNKKAATATIKIAVVDPKYPYSVKIIQEDGAELQDGVELKAGETLKLNASIEPTSATEKTGLTWSISKSQKKYATVDADGTVHGVKSGKTVTVTVKTANGKKDTIKVKVVP